MMDVCRRKKVTDSKKAPCGSVQQPPSSTSSLNKESPPNRAEDNSDSIKTERPCTSTTVDAHSTKRRMEDDEDEGHHGSERKRFKESPTQPSTSSHSSQTQTDVSPRVKRKKDHDDDSENKRARKSHPDNSSHNLTTTHHAPPVWSKESAEQHHPSHSTHNQTQLERKRSAPDDEDLRKDLRKKQKLPSDH